MAEATRRRRAEITRWPQSQTRSPASCQRSALQTTAVGSRRSEANSPITSIDALKHFSSPRLGSERIFHLSMQEDRQPNEIRIQRKGDHRIPKVRSSASLGPYRQSRFPNATRSKANKPWRKGTSRNHHEGVSVDTGDSPGTQRWNGQQKPSLPPLRGSTSTVRDKPTTNRQPGGNVSTPDMYGGNL